MLLREPQSPNCLGMYLLEVICTCNLYLHKSGCFVHQPSRPQHQLASSVFRVREPGLGSVLLLGGRSRHLGVQKSVLTTIIIHVGCVQYIYFT